MDLPAYSRPAKFRCGRKYEERHNAGELAAKRLLAGRLLAHRPSRNRYLAQAKQLSFSWLYWMQTDALRPDGGMGWKGLRLRKDVVGTVDGLAKSPYIRESRRIEAEFTMLEQHVGTRSRSS